MTQTANVYAQALYTLAREEDLCDKVLEEMNALEKIFRQEPVYMQLLSAANLSKEERCNILDEGFRGKVQPYVLNFMKLLTERGYIRQFPDCCKAFAAQYDLEHGILPVQVVSAVALTDAQQEKLTKKLETITGKTIRLTSRIEPACLGGLRLDYDGKRVDGTVQNRLDSIGKMLRNTVL